MSTSITADTAAQSRKVKITSWVLQVLAAAAFLAAGGAKLAGAPMMVAIFDHIGIGQWFRVVTGSVEVLGAIALLIPATAVFGALLLAITMTCAVLTHLLVIGGNPGPAIVLLVINALIVWMLRSKITALLARLR